MLQTLRIKFLVIIWFLFAAQSVAAQCRVDYVSIKGEGGQSAFTVEVMDTNEERAQGLMFRESLPRFSGMLFVYDEPQSVSFWMRNTRIPLDMVFADQAGVVSKVHANAIPGDETSIYGGDDILVVLEINAGLADLLKIRPGAVLQHPSFDPAQAAWPCKK